MTFSSSLRRIGTRLSVAALISGAALLSSCGSSSSDIKATGPIVEKGGYYTGPALDTMTSNPNRLVTIETKQGIIKLQLFDKIAPKHVAHMIELVKSGFYNGLTFHRIIPGFMIQGGDPNSRDEDLGNDGYGDPSLQKVQAEFSKLEHKRGILSAARSTDPHSATSQFFICHASAPSLNGKYSIYGQVVDGMDVVDKIAQLPKITGDNPGKEALIIRMTINE
jgi:cyclophilin family peptidyl-prolyl cis-trans isomerase